LNDSKSNVSQRLFGTESESRLAVEEGYAPGDVGRDSPCLLYLSGLQGLDPELFQQIHRLIASREYLDPLGHRWRLSSNLLIFGAMSFPNEVVNVTPEHWVTSVFANILQIIPRFSTDELAVLCGNILRIEIIDRTPFSNILELLEQSLRSADDGLHSLRRWLQSLATEALPTNILNLSQVSQIIARDIDYLLRKIEYRGNFLSQAKFNLWSQQFPSDMRYYPSVILKNIADKYYIGSQKYHSRFCQVGTFDRVFCNRL